jgi:hypothetical protein
VDINPPNLPTRAHYKSVGRGSPMDNLTTALVGIFKFHQRIVPRTAGLFAEPELLAVYSKSLARQGKGPHLSMAALVEYITAEQELGHIDSSVEPGLAAYLLMSSSFFRAFMENFSGKAMRPPWNHLPGGWLRRWHRSCGDRIERNTNGDSQRVLSYLTVPAAQQPPDATPLGSQEAAHRGYPWRARRQCPP